MVLSKWLSTGSQLCDGSMISVSRRFRSRVAKQSNFRPWFERLEDRLLLAVLGLGDMAFTGYQSVTPDKISFVLLKTVDAGTVLSISDNAWSGSALTTNEGSSIITFNGDFTAGTQLNFDATRTAGSRWAVGTTTTNLTDVTSSNFALAAAGDNLFAYNGSVAPADGTSSLWVAAFATNPFLTSGSTSTSLTFLPSVFASTNSQLSLGIANGTANENGVYSGGNAGGTADQIRTIVNSVANWTTFTAAGAQAIPPSATFTVQAGSGNSAPAGLTLSNSTIQENSGANAVVGTFSTTDPNAGDTFTYSLVAGTGSTDNSSFNILGSTLRANANLSASQGSLSIRVRTTDQGGLFFEQSFTIQVLSATSASSLRIVSYNIASADAPGTPRTGLDTILQGIGSEVVAGLSRPIDLLAIQEVFSQSSTTQLVVNMLNSIYGAGFYARGSLNGGSTGAGTQGVVYNTQSLQLLGESVVGTASSGTQPRQTMRYQFRPVGGTASTEFYLYNSHWKANNDAPSEAQRLNEAQAIRADADALGDGKNVIYVGDFNLYDGADASFQFMLGAGAGQAHDPVNRVGSWSGNTSFRDIFTQAPSASPPTGLTGGGLDDRFDFQIVTGEFLDGAGIDYRNGSYHTFGNNGSVAVNGSINNASNTALAGLSNRTQILDLLTTVTDHLPVVADYTLSTGNSMAISPASVSALEGTGSNSTFTFTVTRTGSGNTQQTVSYAVTGSGINPASASDFVGGVLPSGTITFPANGSLTQTVSIQVAGDSMIELDEAFTVTLSNPSSGATLTSSAAVGTIQNDDLPSLTAGDLLITAVNATNPDQFSFIPLVDLPENSQIYFTDNAWDGAAFSSTEGTVTYIVPVGGIQRGTKVVVTVSTTVTANVGTASATSGFALSTAGDNLFAYYGTSSSPAFLFGLNTNVSYLSSGTTSASTTYLPASLAVGLSATAPLGTTAAVANSQYNHALGIAGSPGRLRELVANRTNWTNSASAISLSTTSFTVLNTLVVDSWSVDSSSVAVRFSKSIDTAKLSLVDSNSLYGASDITLMGSSTGAVRGSVVFDSDNRGLTFIKTGEPLSADTYTLTLRSASTGLTDLTGELLDGDSNNSAGGDFTQQVTVAAPASGAITLRVGDIVRGYGQSVNLPANTSNGIPITISSGVNVSGVSLTLSFNPVLLSITGATTIVAGATVTLDTSVSGIANVTVTSSSAFSSTTGTLSLVNLMATIPATAPSGAKSLLKFSNVSITSADGGSLVTALDHGLLVAAYKGDVNNSRSITTGDVTGLLRTISGTLNTNGFPNLRLADPTLVGDMNDSASLTTGDATGLLRFISGASGGFPLIPALPTGLTAPPTGPDPQVYIPQNLAVDRGGSIVVPIMFDIKEKSGASIAGIDIAFAYDDSRFSISRVEIGSTFQNSSFVLSNNLAVPGLARLVLATSNGPFFACGQVGALVNVALIAKPDAEFGRSIVNLVTVGLSDNNTDDLVITSPITAGFDSSDGVIFVGDMKSSPRIELLDLRTDSNVGLSIPLDLKRAELNRERSKTHAVVSHSCESIESIRSLIFATYNPEDFKVSVRDAANELTKSRLPTITLNRAGKKLTLGLPQLGSKYIAENAQSSLQNLIKP